MKLKKLMAAVLAVVLSLSGQPAVSVFAEETTPVKTEETTEKTAENEEKETSEEAEEESEDVKETTETKDAEEENEAEEKEDSETKKEEETEREERKEPQRDALEKELTSAGELLLKNGVSADALYTELNWTSQKDDLPKQFDQREEKVQAEDQEVHLLPTPAGHDDSGKYKYMEAGTEAIKMELLEGKPVTVGYHADHSTPLSDEAADCLSSIYRLQDLKDIDDEVKVLFAEYTLGNKDPYSLTVEEVQNLIHVRLAMEKLKDDLYDLKDMTRDELADLLTSKAFGKPMEEVMEASEETEQYINVSGPECTWAHYTYNDEAEADETVTIVGWDDSYAKENFISGHQPSSNGAWIVKSGFSEEWGMNGYFYLSYYDKSISSPVSYGGEAHELPSRSMLNATVSDTQVSTAKVLRFEEDTVLEEIEVVTGELNTMVTAYVYLLNEDAEKPTDGVLLDCVSAVYTFAGWHVLPLNLNVLVEKDSCISVVTVQSVNDGKKTRYVLVNTVDCAEEDLVIEEIAEEPETVEAKPAPEEKQEEAETENEETAADTEEEVSEAEKPETEAVMESEEKAEEEEAETEETAEEIKEPEEESEEAEEADKADETAEEGEEQEELLKSGTTYISYGEDVWYVWTSEIEQMQAENEVMAQLVYEELPVNVSTVAFKDLEKEHKFSEPVAFLGGHALICPECGLVLVKGN